MGPSDGSKAGTLFGAIKQVLEGAVPLSILCCGFGTGGALASLGATRLALAFPDADCTCIAFGSP